MAPQADFGIYNYRRKFITPEVFKRHIQYFSKRYTILELDDAITKFQSGTLPPRALVITFDDGYRNFYDYAMPTLIRYGMPATIFIATDFVLRNTPLWVDRLEYAAGQGPGSRLAREQLDAQLRSQLKRMTPEEREAALVRLEEGRTALRDFEDERRVYAPLTVDMLNDMQKHGITIGAHTRSHPVLSAQEPAEAESEIAGSLQELGNVVGQLSSVFAYPNGQLGDFTDENILAVRRSGCNAALTTIEGVNAPNADLYRLKRITLDGIDTEAMLAAAVSGLRAKLREYTPWKKR